MDIAQLSIPELENLLGKWVHEVTTTGEAWAKAKSAYETLDDHKKVKIAQFKTLFEGTNAFKEEKALASPEYEAFVKILGIAREKYFHAQVHYDAARQRIDVLRSLYSGRKEQVKNFRG